MKRSPVLALARIAAPGAVPADAVPVPCLVVHAEAVELWTHP
jgi:hypothetical protein